MHRTVIRPLVLTSAFLAVASAAFAEAVVDEATGVRLEPPTGWERMSPPNNPKAPSLAFATPEAMHDGLRSVLVVNTQASAATTEAARQKLVADTMRMVRERMSQPPTNGKFEEPQDAPLAGRPGKVVSYSVQANGQPVQIKQWYAAIDDRFVSVTYTAGEAIFASHLAEAEKAVASMQMNESATSRPAR